MPKLPFSKYAHSEIVAKVAEGMAAVNELNYYLELGTQRGATFNKVRHFVSREAWGVDIEPYGDKLTDCRFFEMTTGEFFLHLEYPPQFDLIWIDACHTHKDSYHDFENALPLVRDNGLILMHDMHPISKEFSGDGACRDCWKTADKIKQNYSSVVEIATIPVYNGITIIRKTKKQVGWM